MKLNRTFVLVALLLLIFAAGCGERIELIGEQQPTTTGAVEQEEGYWDGGEFAGRPVYSLGRGVSQVLHDDFEECLLEDGDIEAAVENYLTYGAERLEIVTRLDEGETTWRQSITVTPISADVYELACSRIEP